MAKVNPRSGTRKKIVVPTYAQAAVWSPIMLISLWVLQGFSAGGEWDGAAPITVERAPVGQRSFFGSFPQIGTPIGMIIATLMLLLFTGMLTNHQFLGWDWRLPFLFSMVLIVVGLAIRRSAEESTLFIEIQLPRKQSSAFLGYLIRPHSRQVILSGQRV